MRIDGRLVDNLHAAVASAKRLRGHPIYSDNQEHWTKLVALARGERATQSSADRAQIDSLIILLEEAMAERAAGNDASRITR